MSTTVHRPTAQRTSQNLRTRLAGALGLILAVVSTAGAQQLRPVSTPSFVDVELGDAHAWIVPGSSDAEDRAVAIALDLVEAAVRSRGRSPIIARISDYPVQFDALSHTRKRQIEAAADRGADLQHRYETAIAWQLTRAIELARTTQPSVIYGIAGVPANTDKHPQALQTNVNYLAALNTADAIIAPESMVHLRNRKLAIPRIRNALDRTGVKIGDQAVLVRINDRWHVATDLGDGTAFVPGMGEDPDDGAGEPNPDQIDDVSFDPNAAMQEFFESVHTEPGSDPVEQLLSAWGSGDAKWDLNADGIIDVQDLLRLLSEWNRFNPSNDVPGDDPADVPGIARFAQPISMYQHGATGSLTLQMLADAPANPNVVFQTWSIAGSGLEAPFVDTEAPFVYPGAALDLVTEGSGEIQAVVRDENNDVAMVVKMPVTFAGTGDPDDDGSSDEPDDPDDDPSDPTDPTDPTDPPDDDPNNTSDDNDNNGTDGGGSSSDGTAPSPVISIMDVTGFAPFTVHVHGLETTLHRGDPLTAQFAWDFGDVSSDYNTLIAWNAAHTYDAPGTYTITLTVTDEDGLEGTATVDVTVLSSTRRVVYVSSGGNDSNDGSNESKAVRSIARGVQLLSDNSELRIRRGSTYHVSSSQMIDEENVVITSYGTGSDPTLWWTGPSSTYAAFFEMNNDSKDIVVERLKFDAPTAANKMSVRGIMPDGMNITVRDCTFGKVSDALNNERQPVGVLIQDNQAGAIGAYFSWCQGSDFSIIGNTVDDSVAEHNIRFGGVDRGLVYGNWLQNTFKACLWCMDGTYAYVSNNEFREGPVTIGPNEVGGSPDAKLHWGVVEENMHSGQGFRAHSGAQHVVYRNNALRYDDKSAFTISGTNENYGRVAKDIRILNNTATNGSARGRFLEITSHADDVLVANNMYVAPNLETGSSKTANVYNIDESMETYTFRNNLWSTPKVVGWGDGWHYIYEYWSNRDGYLDMAEWGMIGSVQSDACREFTATDLNGVFDSEFEEAEVGNAQPGVHRDLNGNPRPLTGTVCAGAVEN